MNIRDLARRGRLAALRAARKAVGPNAAGAYAHRLSAETRFFSDCPDAQELPPIYEYWSNRFLRPRLERFGFGDPEAVFNHYFDAAYKRSKSPRRAFLSVGSEAGETEVRIAEDVVRRGNRDFASNVWN